jgi:hypothetical protein
VHREQFRKSRTCRGRQCKPLPLDWFKGHWTTRSLVLLPCHTRDGFDRTASAAGDQGKACSHTTHNVIVLLLFFFPRLCRKSQWDDSAVLFRLRNNKLPCSRPKAGCASEKGKLRGRSSPQSGNSSRNLFTSRTTSRDARLEMANAM